MKTIVHLLSILLLIFSCYESQAQKDTFKSSPPKRIWVTSSVGFDSSFGKEDEKMDFGAGIALNYGHKWFWQLAFQTSTQLTVSEGKVAHTNSLGIGRGYSHARKWGRISFSGGPAIVWGRNYKAENYTTGGVTLSGQILFTPLRNLGLGVELYSNLNPEVSTYGIRGVFNLGWAKKLF